VYDADLAPGWAIGDALNGGYLLGVVARALTDGMPHPHPFTVSTHFLSATAPGPATVRTELVRSGRSLSTGTASLLQKDEDGTEVERLRVLATHGDLAALSDDVRTAAKPPELPPYEHCFGTEDSPGGSTPAMAERLDMRLDPATVGFAVGAPSGKGEMRAWFGLADGRAPDPLSLLMTVDALPPAAFELGVSGWVPTIELSTHIRALPAPGRLRVALSTRNLAGGFLEEDAEVWDSADRLVAQSRQLARAPRG
jgi:hypothetical protein